MDTIENLLYKEGPMLSSHIVQRYVKGKLSAETVRQRVSRTRGAVQRLKGINFPNREKFLFINTQFGTDEFKTSLMEAFEETRSAYGRAIMGLKNQVGSITASQFPIVSGLPIQNAKGQLLHAIVEENLFKLRLISREGDLISLWNAQYPTRNQQAAKILEDILLGMVQKLFIQLGWSSMNSLKIRGGTRLPQFGQFAWDIVGPCYLSGMRTYQKGALNPGFLVGDILINKTISLLDLWPFLSKWDALQAQQRKHRFQPVFIGESFSPEALLELRKRGALIGIPAVLFGKETAKDLYKLMDVIENAAAAVTEDPEAVFELLSRMAKIEGAALNLRGVVIEMIIGHLYQLEGYAIDLRKPIKSKSGERAEIDVFAKNRQNIFCCECKGKSPHVLVDAPEIEKWENEKLLIIKAWLKEDHAIAQHNKQYEFYSSTGYTKEAKNLIKKIESKDENIKFYSGDDIIEQLKKQQEGSLVNIFREQFFREN